MTIIEKGIMYAGSIFITETIKELVKQCVTPQLKNFYDNSCKDAELTNVEIKIEDYLERTYKNNSIMSTIVFKNQQKKLDDLYIPLTVKISSENKKNTTHEIYIDKYHEKFLPLYNKVLLVDNAGMGKSTLMKFLYLSIIREQKGIPIIIELRKLEKDTSIIDFIINDINGISGNCKKEILLELIERGDFIYFFDGYDEINPDIKNKVTENLQDFINKAYKSKFIISSREEDELSSFGDFQRFDIKSLNKEEAYKLIEKYDENGELYEQLIEKLEEEENLKILKEFLENPLMVSLLYKAFDYSKIIPYKKNLFYEQVYSALFEQHDASKSGAYKRPKKSKLDKDDFNRILRCIGFITIAKGISYSREEILKYIDIAKKKTLIIDFKSSDFLYDITHSVPIMTKDGYNVKWVHKSFQEYFAAKYICEDSKEQQKNILETISSKDKIYKYYNVLDFCYDMNNKQFLRCVLYPFICKLEEFYNNSYLEDKFKEFDEKEIERRKILEFLYGDMLIQNYIRNKKEDNDVKDDDNDIVDSIFKGVDRKGRAVSIIHSKEALALMFNSSNNSLIKLLKNKNSSIIKEIDRSKNIFKLAEELTEFIGSEYLAINDDTNNILNKKECFKMINDFVEGVTSSLGHRNIGASLDYNKCIKMKNSIENEIEEEKNDIDFL
ncbi:NACHT domain-containing protein [Clostridium perfringens]|uniref:NACHT domain-containing protein n=1 Tax=Clostridium perfringens TaxID=1502 RepID=UPI0022E5D479|nr:NACHT domain-containing protein [Clostridium perfringens]ELC8385755.1 NACHT domain-containing protein [Clostridium perfringens]MDK0543280.1 NACHT domain-containing protein [Clostridium perfringens]MDK0738838.1 NACHT domain-containing protein [Clostridium perfringens]MDK0786783.1 NACHT domain-containing protein [Clostridium perfringens]MDM0622089.1 NACHT domain-containing protein [Clostridium perfringens]